MTITYISDRETYLCAELQKRDLALADTVALCTHLVRQRDMAQRSEYIANHNRNLAIQKAQRSDQRTIKIIKLFREHLEGCK